MQKNHVFSCWAGQDMYNEAGTFILCWDCLYSLCLSIMPHHTYSWLSVTTLLLFTTSWWPWQARQHSPCSRLEEISSPRCQHLPQQLQLLNALVQLLQTQQQKIEQLHLIHTPKLFLQAPAACTVLQVTSACTLLKKGEASSNRERETRISREAGMTLCPIVPGKPEALIKIYECSPKSIYRARKWLTSS